MEALLPFHSAPTILHRMEINTSVSLAANRSAAPSGAENFFAKPGPDQRTQWRKEKSMNDQNRVLVRKGARELTGEEVEQVSGGLRTATKCTLTAAAAFDGDLHECSWPIPGGVLAGTAERTLLKSLGPINGPNDERRKHE
jgi:hypothetical protein